MAPVTLAGALVEQNAEALAGLALSQLANPGAPFVYGGFTSNVDMKSGAPAFGTPEYMKACIIGGQLARRYKLPYRTSSTNAANSVDAQAAYETVFSLWGAIMGGGNLIVARRRLDGGRPRRVLREIRARRRPAADGRGIPEAGRSSTMSAMALDAMLRGRARAAISSAPSTRWSAMRPPSTSR